MLDSHCERSGTVPPGAGVGVGVGVGVGRGVGAGVGVGVGLGFGVGPAFVWARAFVLSTARSSARRDRIALHLALRATVYIPVLHGHSFWTKIAHMGRVVWQVRYHSGNYHVGRSL
jgi:hypothetical protein